MVLSAAAVAARARVVSPKTAKKAFSRLKGFMGSPPGGKPDYLDLLNRELRSKILRFSARARKVVDAPRVAGPLNGYPWSGAVGRTDGSANRGAPSAARAAPGKTPLASAVRSSNAALVVRVHRRCGLFHLPRRIRG